MPANIMYDLSIPAISRLQQSLPQQAGSFMESVSVAFDPKYAFLIYTPIVYILNPLVGKRLILAIVLAEWLNQILKWAAFGERPYWYLHSSGRFNPSDYPIHQFPVTCETGPGAPSGHSQLTAAVWLVILESINDLIQEHFKQPRQGYTINSRSLESSSSLLSSLSSRLLSQPKRLRLMSNLVYVSLVSLVAISRVYLACHFPQQCVAGAILGYLIAKYALRVYPKPNELVMLSFGMLVSAFGVYGIMIFFGFNPSWTFELASKHCSNPDYIHIDSTPFFSIMRYCGFALGAGLGLLIMRPFVTSAASGLVVQSGASSTSQSTINLSSSVVEDVDAKERFNFALVSTRIAVALIAARLVDNLGAFVSHSNLSVFYPAAFFTYTFFSALIVSL